MNFIGTVEEFHRSSIGTLQDLHKNSMRNMMLGHYDDDMMIGYYDEMMSGDMMYGMK